MKKKYFLLLGIIILSFFTTACSTNNIPTVSSDKSISDVSETKTPTQPDRSPDVGGVIKSINSNEIVVAIVERQTSDDSASASKESSSALGVTTGTGMPGSGSGKNRDASVSDTDRLARMLERSTGQEKILVPVGIAMSKTDENNDERVEAIFSDLKAGTIVNIWLNEDVKDKKIAEFVSIR